MPNNYKLVIYPEAQEEIENAFAYIAYELGSGSAALALIRDLRRAIDNVRLMPHSCPVYISENVENTDIRKLIVKRFIAFYIANDQTKTIEIVRFIYGKRNISNLIK